MGLWMNVAFVRTEDLGALEAEVTRLVEEAGRRLVRARPRTPQPYDPMQYGHGAEAPRWGIAGFHAVPGWCALRTAPFELLIDGEAPLLPRLTERLGTVAFQYNAYDSSGEFLAEADAAGALERSGVGDSDNWQRLWGGEEPRMDRLEVRFHRVDPRPVARLARERWPHLRVSEVAPWGPRPAPMTDAEVLAILTPELRAQWEAQRELRERMQQPRDKSPEEAQEEEALRAWLAVVKGETFTREGPRGSLGFWSAHPADVVLAMVEGQGAGFLGVDVKAEAVRLVFGGEAAEHCDNTFLVQTLVPHAPLPVRPAFVLYGDRVSDSRGR